MQAAPSCLLRLELKYVCQSTFSESHALSFSILGQTFPSLPIMRLVLVRRSHALSHHLSSPFCCFPRKPQASLFSSSSSPVLIVIPIQIRIFIRILKSICTLICIRMLTCILNLLCILVLLHQLTLLLHLLLLQILLRPFHLISCHARFFSTW